MAKQLVSLTVGELIEQLQNFDEDLPVVFSYTYGDHWSTIVLGEIGQVEEEVADWSDYHEQFCLRDNEGETPVLVLS